MNDRLARLLIAVLCVGLLVTSVALVLDGRGRTASAPTPSASATPAATSTSTGSPAGSPAPTASTAPLQAPDRQPVALPEVKPKGFVDALPGDGLEPYQQQKLRWKDCAGAGDCATVRAPLDYAAPQEQAITLALRRVKATKKPYLGTLFVNPGGPGEPGTGLAAHFDRGGLEQYDIVGWDPRGTGSSTPVQCANGEAVDDLLDLDASPDTEAERTELEKGTRAFALTCVQKSGPLLAHVSTTDTVKDLDLLRELVGDDKLTYLGYSYGTQIGSYYAELFPKNVGRMVLDSAVDIVDDKTIIQAMGFDLALKHFAEWCVNSSDECRLGSDVDAVLARYTRLFETLDEKPLRVPGGRMLTQSLAVTGVVAFLYDEESWPYLAAATTMAARGDGSYLLYAADFLNAREKNGQYDARQFAFTAIGCADYTDEGVARAYAEWKEDAEKAPIFGTHFGVGLNCPLWPVAPAPQVWPKGAGAAPILVVGTTGDSATPYKQAVTMAKTLESGVLLTYDGEGHAAYGGKNACVDKTVVAYLANGRVPEDGTTCR